MVSVPDAALGGKTGKPGFCRQEYVARLGRFRRFPTGFLHGRSLAWQDRPQAGSIGVRFDFQSAVDLANPLPHSCKSYARSPGGTKSLQGFRSNSVAKIADRKDQV